MLTPRIPPIEVNKNPNQGEEIDKTAIPTPIAYLTVETKTIPTTTDHSML